MFDDLYRLSQRVKAEQKQMNRPRNKSEQAEFLAIAKDMAQGRRPFSFTRQDQYGNPKTYSYAGDIWYSEISQAVRHFTTYEKRSRAYDFVHDYLIKKKMYIHS